MERAWFLVYEGIQGIVEAPTPVWTEDQLLMYLESMVRYNPHLKEIKVLDNQQICQYIYRENMLQAVANRLYFVLEVEGVTPSKEVKFDFQFQLKEAVRYQQGLNPQIAFEVRYCSMDEVEGFLGHLRAEDRWIPVGSIEFVLKAYQSWYGWETDKILPLNIPSELNHPLYLGRQVVERKADWKGTPPSEVFYQEPHRFRGIADICSWEETPEVGLISEVIPSLKSEWRCFIWQGQLVDVRMYQGDYRTLPNESLIQSMIEKLKDKYSSYVLDVGVTVEGQTVLIEVHQFFSCELYGMNRWDCLPQMFYATHLDFIKQFQKAKGRRG